VAVYQFIPLESVCVCVGVCARARVRVRACVCVCRWVGGYLSGRDYVMEYLKGDLNM
jgi:hypothetical protein